MSVGGQAYLVSDAQVDSGWEWDWIGVESAPHAEEQNQPRYWSAVKFANWGLLWNILFSSQPSDSLSPKAHANFMAAQSFRCRYRQPDLANNLECPKSEALSIQMRSTTELDKLLAIEIEILYRFIQVSNWLSLCV